MDILIIGDYSNHSCTLAHALRQQGHTVTLMSNGSAELNTERDLDISRPLPGKAGGMALWLRLRTALAPRLRGHDAVLINTTLPVDLKPARNAALISSLRQHNGIVAMMVTGNDTVVLDALADPHSGLTYSEQRREDGSPTPYALSREGREAFRAWHEPALATHVRSTYGALPLALPCLYEYDVAARRVMAPSAVHYTGIPVDTGAVSAAAPAAPGAKIRIFLGRRRKYMAFKGTDMLEAAARRVVERWPHLAELVVVEDVPYATYCGLLDGAHIVLDQVYAHSPATNALLAMARGQTVVTGASDAFYSFIGEKELRPILPARPDVDYLAGMIEEAVKHPERLRDNAAAAREFVERHNSMPVVARRVTDALAPFLNQH